MRYLVLCILDLLFAFGCSISFLETLGRDRMWKIWAILLLFGVWNAVVVWNYMQMMRIF